MKIKRAIKLKKVVIHKYKSFTEEQEVNIEDDITVLVGKNESGKTAFLECLAKSNYFQSDSKFTFSLQLDYPRKELKSRNKDQDSIAIRCIYELSDDIFTSIEKQLGKNIWAGNSEIIRETSFENGNTIQEVNVDAQQFFKNLNINIDENNLEKFLDINSPEELAEIKKKYANSIENLDKIDSFIIDNKVKWSNFIEKYIYFKIIQPRIPKFIYYDEYYQLPSDIRLEDFQKENLKLTDDLKTAKAFLELADMNLKEVLESGDYEKYRAELESTAINISDTLFDYWKQNNNLEILLDIEAKEEKATKTFNVNGPYGRTEEKIESYTIVAHYLKLRVRNLKTRMTLPLHNRSKGFNWFFSFIVWFEKMQEDPSSSYILLLDEPGLNLHASAQADLLRFFDYLKDKYQIIYTTHSPFMIEMDRLSRVRTVFDNASKIDKGSVVQDTIQQKDPDTLFPLQAALGYDLAQNLFISPKNLLVEGVSDLLYLETLSEFLKAQDREGLTQDISIVPTGGLDKVATFISLLRGSKLKMVCLLDSFEDQKAKVKLDKMHQEKIIPLKNIKFFHEFLENRQKADIEDIFEPQEYLQLFNKTFPVKKIEIEDLDKKIEGIIKQVNNLMHENRFNHYKPAYQFSTDPAFCNNLSKETLDRFENIFKTVNKLFT
ncbi:MAG: ATP-binding protein [Bifidobacteriales bacterium]|uniref:AAA family ATPase n=2 Tax=unclassified Commensalibacter TaxID=2630218 RepID=UPI0012D8C809|nr:AAA family ATPase [Commensalibacter sp. ESL0382]MCT6837990.1 ATP-binding protein [Bifidobacteriales bacterium]MUG34780.1 AAA family ATPase [Commensalibacter sp. ESL0382]